MIELRARACADFFATRRVALEEQDVKSVRQFDELVLGNLLLAPELISFWCNRLLLEASRLPDMQVNNPHPVCRFFFAVGLEKELAIVPIECDFELFLVL